MRVASFMLAFGLDCISWTPRTYSETDALVLFGLKFQDDSDQYVLVVSHNKSRLEGKKLLWQFKCNKIF